MTAGKAAAPDQTPVAVVGIGCRLPGGVDGPDAFWRLLCDAESVIRPLPEHRDLGAGDASAELLDSPSAQRAGWLDEIDGFDAEFFGISPREARTMDPQQRMFLEVAWEALEHAGIPPTRLAGSNASVYASVLTSDYRMLLSRAQGIGGIDLHYGSGNVASFLSGRLSYCLGLRGPSITLDTACSSSLLTVHMACQALAGGETDVALAGGVNLVLSPEVTLYLAKTGALSPRGECRAFDATADGTMRGEGCGVVVLKRLDDARADGDPVLAIVRGSAVNHDGASAGLTAPSTAAQTVLLRTALDRAGVKADEVGYVEAHGTGTRLGDPIEASAIGSVYGRGREPGEAVMVGSVKALIGHLDSAAGIAGMIKAVLALGHGRVPRQPSFEQPNPLIKWDDWRMRVPQGEQEYPQSGDCRYAGVTSLGLSGTNVHVVLAEGEPVTTRTASATGRGDGSGARAWPVSARSAAGLEAQARRLHGWVADRPEVGVDALARSLGVHRAHLEHRAVIVGTDRDQLLSGLDTVAGGAPSPNVLQGHGRGGPLALVFHGQGGQRPQMGRDLHDAYPVFAAALDRVSAALEPHLGRPLIELMFAAPESAEAALLDETAITQTAVFAIEVALFELLSALGVRPAYLIGHSLGEIAAAHAGGILDLDDAAALVAARGQLMGALPKGGAMVALEAGEDEVAERLSSYGGAVSLAAVNGPRATVISGDETPALEVKASFEAEGRRTRHLRISHASHSHHMDGMLDGFAEVAAGLTFSPPVLPVVSSVTGRPFSKAELEDPGYWRHNVRDHVRFTEGIDWLQDEGARHYLELGPDSLLTANLRSCLTDADESLTVAAMRRGRPEVETFVECVAHLHVSGVGINWDALCAELPDPPLTLPTYAFQHQRHWLTAGAASADVSAAGLDTTGHPLLGAAVPIAEGDQLLLTGRVSLATHPWLGDHRILDRVLFPGTAFLEVAFQAASHVEAAAIDELVLESPLVIPAAGSVQLQVTVGPASEEGERSIAIYSRPDTGEQGEVVWTRHASGFTAPVAPVAETDPELAGLWPPIGSEPLDISALYQRLRDAGFHYGEAFQGLRAAWKRGDDVFAEVSLQGIHAEEAEQYDVHPALLDSALHAIFTASDAEAAQERLVPFSWSGVELGRGGCSDVRVRLQRTGPADVALSVAERTGAPVVTAASAVLRPISVEQLQVAGDRAEPALLRTQWSDQAGRPDPDADWADLTLLGDLPHADALAADRFVDLTALRAAMDAGAPAPARVLAFAGVNESELDAGETAAAARDLTERALTRLQEWLSDERLAESQLALATHRAIPATPGEPPGLVQAPLWGLLRSAQAEHPGRFVIVDIDDSHASAQALPGVIASGEPQCAIRLGRMLAPRLARAGAALLKLPRHTPHWRLDVEGGGTLDGLRIVPAPDADRPLDATEVRVAIQAAGLNFRDVLVALDMYPGDAPALGGEAAGVVTEIGSGVRDLAVGDRVAGFIPRAFGPSGITDHRLLTVLGDDWTFVHGASVPIAALTAYHGLVDLAGVQPGDRVLIHAAAGGVGFAAVQIARALGAEVYATASPVKWALLRVLGLDEAHLASSRDVDGMVDTFLEATGGEGMDVVLNSLTGDFIDASLELMPRGGRFVEIGKLEPRDADELAARPASIAYQAFDLSEVDPDRLHQMLAEVFGMIDRGELNHPPIAVCDVRSAPEAFRLLSQGRHIGKLVLTMPESFGGGHTVLITGGTGGVGRLVARHLVETEQVRHVVLTSRRGPEAAGAAEVRAELEALGAEVAIVACDIADRAQVARLLEGIAPERPLTAVVHAAGVIDDGMLEGLTPERVAAVMRPKVDGALHLHELTADLDLDEFVLFSSSVGTLGAPGQANYAAANAFLDALAAYRRAQGLAGRSLAWGLWALESEMTAHLDESDLGRLRSSGYAAMTDDEALGLFDDARAGAETTVVALSLDIAALRDRGRDGELPHLLRRLVPVSAGGARPRTRAAHGLAPGADMLGLVRNEVARVLGHAAGDKIAVDRPFKELGIDSLGAVELKNRLTAATGVRLPTTLVFDYPTPAAIAERLSASASAPAAAEPSPPGAAVVAELGRLIDASDRDAELRAQLDLPLRELSTRLRAMFAGATGDRELDEASDEELVELVDGLLDS